MTVPKKYPPALTAQELDILEATARAVLQTEGITDSLTGTGASQEAQHSYLWLRFIGMIRRERES